MKYVIMCGGQYEKWKNRTPRQLLKIDEHEVLIQRTIRLLKNNGVDDIVITSNDSRFEGYGVPVIYRENNYHAVKYNDFTGHWYEAFWLTDEPVCYIFGDVVFSPRAIRTIVTTDTDDIQFFASRPPFAPEYPKQFVEPFALKVVNTERFKKALQDVEKYEKEGRFNRKPIMWEVWAVINGNKDLTAIEFDSYVAINDYTCDIDNPQDIAFFGGKL